MNPVYWYSLVPEADTFCRDALDELTQKLHERVPDLPKVMFERIASEDIDFVSDPRTYQRGGFACSGDTNPLRYQRLFVFCQGDEPFVTEAQKQNPDALWGAAVTDPHGIVPYALAWRPDNKYLLWHEALHVLGADDCYDRSSGASTCPEQRCIMQYVPNEQNCSGDLFLCQNTIARLKMNAE